MTMAKRKVFQAECLETDNMKQHLHSIHNTADNLTMLNHPIPDMDLTVVILMSLPPSYNSLINLLNYTKGLKLDINHIITYILKHD